MNFVLIDSLEELKEYEYQQGYRGHKDPGLDALTGDNDPEIYPCLVLTEFTFENYNSRDHYNRIVITIDLAWRLLWAGALKSAKSKG